MNDLEKYLITDPQYYTNDLIKFEKKLKLVLESKDIDYACFRDKTSSNIKELAQLFIKVCKAYKIKNIFINQEIILAYELNYDGVHLTSKQFDKIEEVKNFGLKTIISCHTFKEIEKAIELNADMVTYSPIFFTPNKGKPKGIEKLYEAVDRYDIDIIALGGIIDEEHIEEIQRTKAKGFASIRYFI